MQFSDSIYLCKSAKRYFVTVDILKKKKKKKLSKFPPTLPNPTLPQLLSIHILFTESFEVKKKRKKRKKPWLHPQSQS